MGRGAEGAHIAHIVRAFEAAGHTVIVVSPPGVDPLRKVGATPLDKSDEKTSGLTKLWKMVSRHAPQILFELLEIGFNLKSIPQLLTLVKQHKIDFIYERSAFFLFAGAYVAQKCDIPLIVEANEAVGIQRARKLILVRLALYCERYTLDRAKATFTVSSYLAAMLKKNSPLDAVINILPNAIDPVRFQQATKRNQIRNKFGLSDQVVMGFAGWFDWWDRLDLLIDIQNELTTSGHNNVVTMLIGHGNMVDELKQQIEKYGLEDKVILTGPVEKEEVLDYIDALDIGVLPHSNEFGSPMVLFEMMALGKPVVAPDVAPVTDVLVSGDNGLIFPKLDVEMLKQHISQLLNNKENREEIGQRAKEMIFKNNTWSKNTERILRIVQYTENSQQGS